MVSALALLLVGSAPALTLEVPAKVAPGSEVVATVWASNPTSKRIVLAKAYAPNGSIGLDWNAGMTREGEKVIRDESGPFIGQWFLGRTIGPERFLILKPGQKVALYQEKFSKHFLQEAYPSTKQEYADASRGDLQPGKYTLRMKYTFQQKADVLAAKPKKPGGWVRMELSPEGRALYKEAWTGSVDLEAGFEVVQG